MYTVLYLSKLFLTFYKHESYTNVDVIIIYNDSNCLHWWMGIKYKFICTQLSLVCWYFLTLIKVFYVLIFILFLFSD